VRLCPETLAKDPDLQHLEPATYLFQLPLKDHCPECQQHAQPKATPTSATGANAQWLSRHSVTEDMVQSMLKYALPFFRDGKVNARRVHDSVKASHPHGLVLQALAYKPCNLARRLRSVPRSYFACCPARQRR